jgi:hypothetical protein
VIKKGVEKINKQKTITMKLQIHMTVLIQKENEINLLMAL